VYRVIREREGKTRASTCFLDKREKKGERKAIENVGRKSGRGKKLWLPRAMAYGKCGGDGNLVAKVLTF